MALRSTEKRREARTPCDNRGSYLKNTAMESYQEGGTTVVNFSSGGMLLHMPKACHPGSIIEVTLPNPKNGQLTTILEARWSQSDKQADTRRYLVGCHALFACF